MRQPRSNSFAPSHINTATQIFLHQTIAESSLEDRKMSSWQPTSIRYGFVFLCLIMLFGVLVMAPALPKVGAKSVRKVTGSLSPPSDWLRQEKSSATPIGQSAQSQKRFSQTGNFQQQGANSMSPLVPQVSQSQEPNEWRRQMASLKEEIGRLGMTPELRGRYQELISQAGDFGSQDPKPYSDSPQPNVTTVSSCISGSLGDSDTTYKRSNPANFPPGSAPTCVANDPIVSYDTYAFNLTGCTTFPTNVTMNLCAAGCTDAGQNLDTLLYVYRTGGATGAGGAVNPFNKGVPCTDMVGGNDDGVGCGANPDSVRSNLTMSLGSGHFVVVIAAFDVPPGQGGLQSSGNYHLLVNVLGANCSLTQEPTAANGIVSGRITAADGTPVSGAVVNLSGTQSRKTITDSNGNYQFDNIETTGFYTVTPSRANYSFSPAERSFSQLGNSTEAAFTAVPIADDVNPLDTPEYFVRQHYLDFLGREPDEAGFNFWSDQMLECGTDAGCLERRRINVSAAYFLSIEFQQTGGLVDGLYRASYGVRPQFAEFMPDTATLARDVVVGRTGWEQLLDANKQAFLDDWVQRPAFRAAYDLLTNDRYVDSLIAHTGVNFTPSERDTLVNALTFGTLSRAGVLQRIAEDERFVAAKRNETFVMMEYFGYLRRDADADGFAFWLNKLNQFGGNFEQAEMVKAFIVSGEYRDRFPR
jgi:hypothetical protein